jgi:CO/xanthine dehydrogenase Mo-binding subunit
VYDGHELPKDINAVTRRSATAMAGQGLMAVAKDNYKRDGATYSFVAAFAEVEVDVETGVYHLLDYHAVADVGTVIHPRALGGQILGRSILGIGHAIGHKWVYDQRYGVALAKRFYQNKPPTILDVPTKMSWSAVELPDPETPQGHQRASVAAGVCGAQRLWTYRQQAPARRLPTPFSYRSARTADG